MYFFIVKSLYIQFPYLSNLRISALSSEYFYTVVYNAFNT